MVYTANKKAVIVLWAMYHSVLYMAGVAIIPSIHFKYEAHS